MRTQKTILLKNSNRFKKKLLYWSQKFDVVTWLDSNNHNQKHAQYDAVLAVEDHKSIKSDHNDAFNKIKAFRSKTKDWIFGYFSYDLKNDIEDLSSSNYDGLGFPDLFFFQPNILLC